MKLFMIAYKLPTPKPPKPTDEEKAVLLKEAQWRRTECNVLESQLEEMQQVYQQGARLKMLLEVYPEKSENENEKTKRWIEGQTL